MRLSKPSSAAAKLYRAETNRRNSQHSTGPRTDEGKARSSQNSFKHGLYSKQLITPGEDAAEFDQLRATLRSEHQPANTTEEMLVDDLAQHFWRLRRFRKMEAQAWAADDFGPYLSSGYLALVTRNLAAAERSFFRTLTTLTKLQKARGFVPQKQLASSPESQRLEPINEEGGVLEAEACLYQPPAGFVPHTSRSDAPASPSCK